MNFIYDYLLIQLYNKLFLGTLFKKSIFIKLKNVFDPVQTCHTQA